jgi:ribosomal protein S18 acetylase RimI-like enzyme
MENVTLTGKVTVEVYRPEWNLQVIALILKIQREEFGVPITLEQQPDLNSIKEFYQKGTGNFWVALYHEKVVGTIALIDIGNRQLALRKMFVAADFRGGEFQTGQLLLEEALGWMRTKGCTDVFLGTLDIFKAAQRFYRRNGFEEIAKSNLPPTFPAMKLDNTFFKKTIGNNEQVSILEYKPEDQPWFENLNRAWIEKFFWMEPVDFDVLQRPDEHIIKPGGTILVAKYNNEIAGVVALKYVKPGVYEFTKMAVAEEYRGRKIGQLLSEAAIEKARSLGAYKIILYSSTKLAPALSLYRKLGFVDVPVDGPYKRSDVKMELPLLAVGDGEQFRIREAGLKDAELLCALGRQTFTDSFESANTPENMRLYLEKTFSVERLRNEILEPGSVFIMIEDGDAVAGYVKVRTGHDPKELGNVKALEIERLYATKHYIGKQVGKMLMDAALSYAKDHDYSCVWLGVWEHNPRAIRFYEKYGFEKFGSHVFEVGTDPQTDLLMKKNLN